MTGDHHNDHVLAELVENGVRGTISLAPGVLVDILEVTAESVDGVTGVVKGRRSAGKRSYPIAETTGTDASGNWYSSRGIRVQVDDGDVHAELSVAVRAGTSIPDVARQIQDRVADSIEMMLGLRTGPIAIHVIEIQPEKGTR
jgi:uncharacterized alkaline shock family protein YloU